MPLGSSKYTSGSGYSVDGGPDVTMDTRPCSTSTYTLLHSQSISLRPSSVNSLPHFTTSSTIKMSVDFTVYSALYTTVSTRLLSPKSHVESQQTINTHVMFIPTASSVVATAGSAGTQTKPSLFSISHTGSSFPATTTSLSSSILKGGVYSSSILTTSKPVSTTDVLYLPTITLTGISTRQPLPVSVSLLLTVPGSEILTTTPVKHTVTQSLSVMPAINMTTSLVYDTSTVASSVAQSPSHDTTSLPTASPYSHVTSPFRVSSTHSGMTETQPVQKVSHLSLLPTSAIVTPSPTHTHMAGIVDTATQPKGSRATRSYGSTPSIAVPEVRSPATLYAAVGGTIGGCVIIAAVIIGFVAVGAILWKRHSKKSSTSYIIGM